MKTIVRQNETASAVPGTALTRRGFMIAAGALALGAQAGEKPASSVFASRGRYERLALAYQTLEIGATHPFSILHVSDTHLTEAYPHEAVAKTGKAALRTRTFGGRQVEALESTLAWARENVDYVLHTGDLMDFQSEANAALVKRYIGPGVFGAMGNHEFYSYLPDEVHTWQEPFKNRSWDLLAKTYPYDARFSARVVNGVNFICLDDVFGTVRPDQVERFRAEVAKGLPIILAMHVPIMTDAIRRAADVFWRGAGRKYRSAAPAPLAGDAKRQCEDATTADFIRMLKREKLLKAILTGHEHITVQERFSPTATQYVVGGNFMFHGQVILIA